MATYVDTEILGNDEQGSNLPDGLRKQIGNYYGIDSSGVVRVSNYQSGKIANHFFVENQDTSDLIPRKKAKIFLSGDASQFRSYTQWRNYVNSIVPTEKTFLDHAFIYMAPAVDNSFNLVQHMPEYENFTKVYDTNELINYNLISYRFKEQRPDVKRIGEMETVFDGSNHLINSQDSLSSLLSNFDQRRKNYSGAAGEIQSKQRNIFKLVENSNHFVEPGHFPFYNKITISELSPHDLLHTSLKNSKKLKNIYQLIKSDLSFSNRSFSVGENALDVKIYDLIRLVTSFDITEFSQKTDEIFLLPEEEISSDQRQDRFVNQIDAIKLVRNLRNFVKNHTRTIKQTLKSRPKQTFRIGYKIEKYLERTTQNPIQTYYTDSTTFYDTQMKFGSDYIYIVKELRVIFGSAYRYTSVEVPNANPDLGLSVEEMTTYDAELTDFSSSEYRAIIEAELVPSVQIAEIQIATINSTFLDVAPYPPEVEFLKEKNGKRMGISLTPGLFKTFVGPQQDPILPDYFYGKYEIFRTTIKPETAQEMENKVAGTVNKTTRITNNQRAIGDSPQNLLSAFFYDRIQENKKYYYSFKSMTFHDTRSEMSPIYEVELVRDSDEYKVLVRHFMIKESDNYSRSKKFKRLIKIQPNPERLFFSEETAIDQYVIGDGTPKLVSQQGSDSKFKIRIKSKHTGKMIDININFSLDSNTSP